MTVERVRRTRVVPSFFLSTDIVLHAIVKGLWNDCY